MCDFIKLTIKVANLPSPVIINCMNKSNSITTQNKYVKKDIKYQATFADNCFLNCVISNDASRKLDFLILVIEALQINATDSFLLKAKDIGLSEDFTSRVNFWKIRCSNPMRKTHTFSSLSNEQINSLVLLISSMADKLYPLIRQLLSSKEPNSISQERWSLFSDRLKSLIRERMNFQRNYIASLLIDDTNNYFRELLVILSLSCGTGGAKRLRASLYYKS